MPDFPKIATPAEVWAAPTRSLTDKVGFGLADNAVGAAQFTQAAADKVWATSARTLTAMTGQPRIDLMGEDMNFEAGTGARKARLDAAVSSRASAADYTASRAAKIDKIQDFLEEGRGSITADGNLQLVREYTGTGKLHCYIDLANMAAGDTTVITQSIRIKPGGPYRVYAQETYSGVQTLPLLHIVMKPSRWGVKIELQQTAGVNRVYDWETLVDQAAA